MNIVDPMSPTPSAMIVPPWMPFALAHLGEKEIPGTQDNVHVVEWLKGTGILHPDDETPWCSAFVNACMREAGVVGTGKANARSWLHWGRELAAPEFGCVAVFSRPPSPANGHVAFYVGETKTTIWVIGGNQNNRVCFAEYPRARLLSYRTAA
jgi:uncharacterized protein (TIGR02594 family)